MIGKIVVLLQDGTPIDAVAIPDNVTLAHEQTKFADRIRDERYKLLVNAYVTLNPTVVNKSVGTKDIPTLISYILTVRTVDRSMG